MNADPCGSGSTALVFSLRMCSRDCCFLFAHVQQGLLSSVCVCAIGIIVFCLRMRSRDCCFLFAHVHLQQGLVFSVGACTAGIVCPVFAHAFVHFTQIVFDALPTS